jgi:hypothetical protein
MNIVLDFFLCGTVSAHILGPYITLFALQSRGVPFLIGTYRFLNIVLLRGTTSFHDHWFYWTGTFLLLLLFLLCQGFFWFFLSMILYSMVASSLTCSIILSETKV